MRLLAGRLTSQIKLSRSALTLSTLSVFLTISVGSATARSRPINAQIVDKHGRVQVTDTFHEPAGNVQVVYSDGHTRIWTRSLRCLLPKVSSSGLVGWTSAVERSAHGVWINDTLLVAKNRQDIIRLHMDRPFIEVWAYTDDNRCVVIRTRWNHGPSFIEQYRIDTGLLVRSCSGSDNQEDTPEWARPYTDEREP